MVASTAIISAMLIHKPIIGGIMISHFRRSCHFCCCSISFATRSLTTQTSTLKQKRSNKSYYRLEALFYQSRQQSSVSYMMAEPLDSIDSSKRQTYGLSDILKYLDQIEDILKSKSNESSPAFIYQHCYPGDDDDKQTFYKVVGNVLAKPMLRTLIYGDINVNKENTETAKTKKIHFDRRIREARVRIEGERMCNFCLNSLKPAALQLDVDLRDTMAPNLLRQMDMLESQMNRDKSSPIILTTGSSTIFSRLASGRHYQGKLDRMISDLFPHLSEAYNQASQKATEREMMEYVIQHDLVLNQQTNDNDIELDEGEEAWIKKEQEWREKRIKAANKCLDRFYSLDAEQTTSSEKQANLTEEGLQSGKRCEDSCIAYLTYERDDLDEQCIVLQNVYVNNRRGKETKYVPPKILKTPKDLNGTGIIWADNLDGGGRHRLCSEFDAIVVSNEEIESIWEAKKTISPSTIHDILSKKLGAVHTLLDDSSAELVYGDGEITRTIPFTSSVDSTRFTFGMFGTELQRPEHSADSIRSIAGSYVVSSDVGEIIRALDNMSDDGMVMVEVELTSALSIVESLRSLVKEVRQSGVDVILIIDKPIDFL